MLISEYEKIRLTRKNIWQALRDYGAHTDLTAVLDDVSADFVDRLARESVKSKSALREMLRKSPAWNEELDALVINGTRTHDTDYNLVWLLANKIINYANLSKLTSAERHTLETALCLFRFPAQQSDDEKAEYIAALEKIAPKAYQPGKKLSRVFKALCKHLNIVDETAGSEFQKLYAQFADELSSKRINFKLFVSINPAHFITMSNPLGDKRGEMLISCHSFNRTDYPFNNGCSGYALDDVTMIAFTVDDPNNPEALNNRKTSRQLFMYKPGNGLLLQSRMYNTDGGTYGAQAISKDYRALVQREISECENAPNLWKTHLYATHERYVRFWKKEGFGGYPDWEYSDFHAVYSIRNDHAYDYDTFDIGTFGICIVCGGDTSEGLYCDSCDPNRERCADCGCMLDEEEMTLVCGENGDERFVCQSCLDASYSRCDDCGRWFDFEHLTYICDDCHVCNDCLERNYSRCEECGEIFEDYLISDVIDADGYHINVCEDCRDRNYVLCSECENYIHKENATLAHHQGDQTYVCKSCLKRNYNRCESCGEVYHKDDLNESRICSDCAENEEEVEEVDCIGEIHLSNAI